MPKFKTIRPYVNPKDLERAAERIVQYVVDHPDVMSEPEPDEEAQRERVFAQFEETVMEVTDRYKVGWVFRNRRFPDTLILADLFQTLYAKGILH